MKIIWITQKNLQCDLDISTWTEMGKCLAKRNHEITLIVVSTPGKQNFSEVSNFNIKGIGVINRFPLVSISFHFQVMLFSLYWLFSMRPDIVITHPYSSLFLLPAKIFARIAAIKTKFVLDIRTLPVSSRSGSDLLKNSLNAFSIRIAKIIFDGITVITPSLQRIISQRFHIKPDRIGIWMSGVDPDHFKPDIAATDLKAGSPKSFNIMYHGVITENRGLLETVQAMVEVNRKFPEINLYFLGKGSGYQKMIKLREEMNLAECIHLHEQISYEDVPKFISGADVGIIPLPDKLCWQVSSPLKLFEYLALGKPVIVSPIEAHTSILKDCRAAIFLKSISPDDIAAAIIQAYSMRDRLPEMGMMGCEFVTKYFSWDYQCAKLEKYMIDLLQK